MSKRTSSVVIEPKRIEFETFRNIGPYEINNLTQKEPTCFNSIIRIRKYRITIELIDEPNEVIADRLRQLWRECDNSHHYEPLRRNAEGLGIELLRDDFGKSKVKV